jgi:Fuc2NAc and GlcNAc transferase
MILVVFAGSALMTRLLIGAASRLRLIDVPNARSSHASPTPRGGGLAIVGGFTASAVWGASTGGAEPRDVVALLVPALMVAIVGLIDDRFGLRAAMRLAVHLLAAAGFLWAVGGLPATGMDLLDRMPMLGNLLAVLAIAWGINLFNFMDGIDGLAGMQAVFVAAGLALLGSMAAVPGLTWLAGGLAAATAGFLAWNWPPARIFMGDVGSGFLGFLLGALSILALRSNQASIWVVLLLPSAFVIDATLTLVMRAARGESLSVAHRSHAYQKLATRWRSHRRVTLLFAAIDLGLLAPCAWFAWQQPQWAVAVALGAGLLLTALAAFAGAGRRD